MSKTQNLEVLVLPLLAVRQLRCQTPADMAFQHLLALLAERAGDRDTAIRELTAICQKLEAEFESSESLKILSRFAQAKSDLGRAQLAEHQWGAATDSARVALDLTADKDIDRETRTRVRLSAHLIAGLASIFTGSMDEAIKMFQSALEETQSDPDVLCLLVRVLWDEGGDQGKNIAREQLFDCIESHPRHFGAVTLLGVIAILDNDTETLEAVIEDLHSLRTSTDLDSEQQFKVTQLLTAVAAVIPGEVGPAIAELSQAQVSVMLAPSRPHGWMELASQAEDSYTAEMAILTAQGSIPPLGPLDATTLSKVYAGTNRLDDAQRSILVAPWAAAGWQTLSQDLQPA